MNNRSFITGSYAYGNPNEESDIDLVLLLSPDERELLRKHSLSGKEPIKYGKLNLIITSSLQRFQVWKEATEDLILLKKEKGIVLDREQTIRYFDLAFLKAGLSKSEGDSGANAE